jgi:hypothetical protein
MCEEIIMRGHGSYQPKTTVTLAEQVTERTRAGEYELIGLLMGDAHGNYIRHEDPPYDIRFRVETPPADFEGPNLTDVRLK